MPLRVCQIALNANLKAKKSLAKQILVISVIFAKLVKKPGLIVLIKVDQVNLILPSAMPREPGGIERKRNCSVQNQLLKSFNQPKVPNDHRRSFSCHDQFPKDGDCLFV